VHRWGWRGFAIFAGVCVAGWLFVGATPSGAATTKAKTALPSAAGLLDVSGYATALGSQVSAVEDDGGFPDPNGGFRSDARIASASGPVFAVSVHSAANLADARSEFSQLTGNGSSVTALPGVGDQAADVDGKVVVRKGSQILTIDVDLAGAASDALDQIKINGGDPTQALQGFQAMGQLLAAPLAAKLTGASVPKAAAVLPKGAIDPCGAAGSVVKAVEKIYKVSSVSASTASSDSPPGVACEISAPGLSTPIEVTTVTDAQLGSSVSSSTAAAEFAGNASSTLAAQSDDVQVSALEEYTDVLHHEPFGWILGIGFPGRSRSCPSNVDLEKGEELIDELIRAVGPSNSSQLQKRSEEYQRIADENQRLANELKQQAEEARAKEQACRDAPR
jgi:hypothetical protein